MSHESFVKRLAPSAGIFTPLLVAALLMLSSIVTAAQTPASPQGSSSISGEVLVNGKPAPNVRVSLTMIKRTEGGVNLGQTTTDSEGKFQFTSITSGTYYVRPLVPGYAFETSGISSLGSPVNVGEGDAVEGVKLRLIKGGVITGRVTDADGHPVIQERISLQRLGPDGKPMSGNVISSASHETDDRGIYRIYALPPGNYLVSAGSETNRNQDGTKKLYSKVYYDQKGGPAEADIVKVTDGEEKKEIDFKFAEQRPAYSISGRIISSSGQAVAGLLVLLSRQPQVSISDFVGSSISGLNGDFNIAGVQRGKYVLTTGSRDAIEEYSDPVEVEVSSVDVSGTELRMRKGATVTGTIAIEGTSDPKVMAAVSTMIVFAETVSETSSILFGSRSHPDSKGSFRLTGIRPGTIRISIGGITGSFSGMPRPRIERAGVIIQDSYVRNSGFEVKSGEEISIRITIPYGTGAIRGKTVVTGGSLPQNSRVTISLFRFEPSISQFVQEGRASLYTGGFVFESLSPGQYQVRAAVVPENPVPASSAASLTFTSQTVVVANGKTEQVTIELDFTAKPRQ